MLPNSLRIRGVHFAFLFGPPRFIRREEASKVHGNVCDGLKYDDLTFRYSGSSVPGNPDSQGFSIAFERKEGRGAFGATIDMKSVNDPIRLLLTYAWPPSLEHVEETFDITAGAVFASIDGEWHRVLAEARIRAQCDTREQKGLAFITGALRGLPRDWLSGLGRPLSSCMVKFEVAATPPTEEDQLAGAKRELQIEVLREDPRGLYIELMCQWPQISSVAPATGSAFDPGNIRQISQKPSEYVENAYHYLEGRVGSLATTEA